MTDYDKNKTKKNRSVRQHIQNPVASKPFEFMLAQVKFGLEQRHSKTNKYNHLKAFSVKYIQPLCG